MRRIIAAILALVALMGLAAVFSPAAFADGDPASDVLSYESIFNPSDSGISAQNEAELAALVKAIRLPIRAGSAARYPVKVAFINSAADLGSITQLWQQPALYSQFLGKELSLEFRGTLLVVMPQGYGLFPNVPLKQITTGDQQAMNNLYAPGSQLAAGAALVLRRLAADNHITLPRTLAVAAPTAAGGGSSSPVPIIGLAAGLVVLAGAWGASLRARPLRRRAVV